MSYYNKIKINNTNNVKLYLGEGKAVFFKI